MTAAVVGACAVIPSPRSEPSMPEAACVLWVPTEQQWLSTTSGRVALDGYSWLQAVHWVAGSGLYEPRRHRSHGPRSFGRTTIRVAQELAQLSPCRPGIEYLVRRTGLSERSVEYHLGMLREAGLLAYIVRGTRVRGQSAQASEFARVIPAEFDAALGMRTVLRDEDAPAYTRAPSGIAESGRKLMAKLGRKASRKVRRTRARPSSNAPARGVRQVTNQAGVTGVSGEARCTPMQVGSSTASPAGTTSFPPENKLASGKSTSHPPKRTKRGRRRLNGVGRRFQLAGELIRRVPWLSRAAVPRIAWILREVSDAGWTADEVIALLDCGDAPERVHRPSGFLSKRLSGAVALWPTAEGRARAVHEYRDSRRAEQARHQEWEGNWQTPRNRSVRRLVEEAILLSGPLLNAADAGPNDLSNFEEPGPEDLAALREAAWGEFMAGETALIMSAVGVSGQPAAERVYGTDLVQRVLKLAGGTSLMSLGRACPSSR